VAPPAGTWLRGTATPDGALRAPSGARDGGDSRRIYWRLPTGQADPFAAGSQWAFNEALTLVYGETIGTLLQELALVTVEQLSPSGVWVVLD